MTLTRIKLGHVVTLMKYLARIVSSIFLPETLISNKINFPTSNSLNLAELVVNENIWSVSKNIYQKSFFCLIFLSYKEFITKELDNFTKILISMVFY